MHTYLKQEFRQEATREENIACRQRLQDFFRDNCGFAVHSATTTISGNVMETTMLMKPDFDQAKWLEEMKKYPTPADFTFSVDPEKGMKEIERVITGPEAEMDKIKEVQLKRYPDAKFVVGEVDIANAPADWSFKQ